MKAKGIFISTLIIVDTFLGAYYFGVHQRSIKVIDPSLKAVEITKEGNASAADDKDNKKVQANTLAPQDKAANEKNKPAITDSKSKKPEKSVKKTSTNKSASEKTKKSKTKKSSKSKKSSAPKPEPKTKSNEKH